MDFYNVLLAKKTNRVLQYGSLYERLFETWINRARQILKDLPTGSISTVNDAAELPLNALKVSVEAWQEGSGTPSPSNIRPIHGWDSGEITVTDDLDNPTQTETTTINFPTTIYGAEWDVVGGSAAEEYGFVEYDGSADEQWAYSVSDSTAKFYIYPPNCLGGGGYGEAITNEFDNVRSSASSVDNNAWIRYTQLHVNPDSTIVPSGTQTAEGLAEFKAWLAQHPLQVMYPLATPTTIDLSPLSIRMLQGINNLYADCGEVLSGKYWAEV